MVRARSWRPRTRRWSRTAGGHPGCAGPVVEMFARDGFGGASTRQIAKHLNLSLLRCTRTTSPRKSCCTRSR